MPRHGLRQSTPWKFFKVSSKGNDRAVVASKRRTTRSRRHLLTCLPESQIILLLRMHGSLLCAQHPCLGERCPWRQRGCTACVKGRARIPHRVFGHESSEDEVFRKTYAEIRKKSPYLWRWPVLSKRTAHRWNCRATRGFMQALSPLHR